MTATFRRILFAPFARGDNHQALSVVSELATRHGAQLSVLASIPEPSRVQRMLHEASYFEEVQHAEAVALRDEIHHWAERAGCEDIEVDIEVGSAPLVILQRVHVQAHDLVVVTSDSHDSDHATVRRLLRKCPCPVWVIRPARAETARVLAAVDPNPAEEQLNRHILSLAVTMANGGEVHVAHAWQLYGEETMRSSAFMSAREGELDLMLKRAEDSVFAAIEQLLDRSVEEEVDWILHVKKGDPTEILPQLVHDQAIDLLVTGTVARSGLSGLVMGNTAERVLDAVSCSVLAVKPPGFTSPIQFGSQDVASGWLSTPI